MEESKISSKGQVVIPKYLRDALDLEEGTIVVMSKVENKIMVMKKPSDSVDSLVKQGGRVGLANIRRQITKE